MAHDFLDRFQVGLILAETGAEGVPQVMSGKMGDFNRGSAFFLRVFQFFKVAVFPHSLQHAVDAAWIKQVSIPVQKDKVGVTVYDRLPQRTALRLLSGMFFQKRGTDFLQHGNGGTLTLGAIVALWSTSLGIAAFQRSVNHAYGVAENQNPIINRAVSFLWMLVILLIVTTLVILYGLGEQTLSSLQPILGFSTKYVTFFRSIKWPVTFWALFVFLTLLYYFVPNALVKLRYVIPGALIADLLWMGLSRVFSYYTMIFAHNITSYKTIGAFIVLMIWLDLSGMVIMIGAAINATLQDAHDGEIKEKKHLWQYVRKMRHREFNDRYHYDEHK